MRYVYFAIAVVVVLIVLLRVTVDEMVSIRLGVSETPLSSPFVIAIENGYFEDENLLPEVTRYKGGHRALQGLLDGTVDVATVTDTPVMFNSFKRDDYAIFTTFVESYNDVKIATFKEEGITEPSDLVGKRIGVTFGASGNFFLNTFLTHNSIDANRVTLVDLQPEEMYDALIDETIDVVVTWEPFIFAMKEQSEDIMILEHNNIYRETFNGVSLKSFIGENNEILQRTTRALYQAVMFINEYPEESQKLVAEYFGIPHASINATWSDFHFDLNLEQSLLLTLEEEARWARENGYVARTSTIPNYLDYVDLSVMTITYPERISIIR